MDQRARNAAKARASYWRHRDEIAQRLRDKGWPHQKRYRSEHPLIRLGSGERVPIDSLPEELRPIARLVFEIRKEVRRQNAEQG